MKENILISKCLLGYNVRFDARIISNKHIYDLLNELKTRYNLIPICPEVEGGLQVPRDPSEIKDNKVINIKGKDVTSYFIKGAEFTLMQGKLHHVKLAILKDKSPSCGVNKIYDGNFSKNVIDGQGITAKLLKENGIKIISENEIADLLEGKITL